CAPPLARRLARRIRSWERRRRRAMSGRIDLARGPLRSARTRAAALAALLALGCGAGCAAPARPRRARALVEAARAEGLPVRDPLALDPRTRAEASATVGEWGSELERMRRLRDYITRGGAAFRYAPVSYGAEDAMRERRGDCMTYSLLFVA